jgi:chromatin segregation and condensation protein Rec8/ScpA/Scc1 (kleisin family)
VTYTQVKNSKAEDFKRLPGVYFDTFNQMLEIAKEAEKVRKKTGRQSRLKIEDQILMVLEYLRKDRTFFHYGDFLAQQWRGVALVVCCFVASRT